MKTNKFNVADSEQYQKNEELRKHQSDVQYKAQFEKEKNNFTTVAVTKEMEQAKQMAELKVTYLCTTQTAVKITSKQVGTLELVKFTSHNDQSQSLSEFIQMRHNRCLSDWDKDVW